MLELSKQDKGGRGIQPYQPSAPSSAAGGSSSQPAYPVVNNPQSQPRQQQTYAPQPPQPEPEAVPDINVATRVRALYTFTSAELGELNFERGDVIKVLDRGFKEWWRGACNGKIGVGLPRGLWGVKGAYVGRIDLPCHLCRGYAGADPDGAAGGSAGGG